MKKLSLLVALALLVSFGAFAQDVSMEYSVTGSATMEWGIDLNNDPITHGFNNGTSSSLDVAVTLAPDAVMADGSGIYGMIELTGFSVEIGDTVGVKWDDVVSVYDKDGDDYDFDMTTFEDGSVTGDADFIADLASGDEEYDYTFINTGFLVTAPDVAAKVVMSDALFLKIASKPDFDYAISGQIEGDTNYAGIDTDHEGGITLGFMSDVAEANVHFVSEKAYDENPAQNYAVGTDITITPSDMISSTLYYAYLPNYGYHAPHYAGLSVDLMPVDLLSVEIDFESSIMESGDLDFDTDVTIPVTVTDALTVTASGSYVDDMATTGAGNEGMLDAKLAVDLTGDAAISFSALANDMLETSTFGMVFDLEASYKLALEGDNYVKPGVTAKYDLGNLEGDGDEVAKLLVSIDTMLIANTVFTLAYESEQLLDEKADAMDKGDIKFTTKISY